MRLTQANPSTAQTNEALIAARSSRFIKVRGVYVSSDTQMIITLVNSVTHDVIWRQYVSVDGGQLIGGTKDTLLTQSTIGEGVDYTTSTNGNVFIKVMYQFNEE